MPGVAQRVVPARDRAVVAVGVVPVADLVHVAADGERRARRHADRARRVRRREARAARGERVEVAASAMNGWPAAPRNFGLCSSDMSTSRLVARMRESIAQRARWTPPVRWEYFLPRAAAPSGWSGPRRNDEASDRSVLLLVVSALCAFGASAQTYPNRPIKLIVADSAGGAPDQLGTPASRRNFRTTLASRSSSTTAPARAARWAPRWPPSRRLTATRCC